MKRPAGRPRPSAETRDTFYRGRVVILQKKQGYRFAVDAPLLADFISTRRTDEALEIGTGSGVISLLLSIKPWRRITALEVQAGLAGLARRNVALNGLGERIEVVRGDLRRWRPERRFDLIFSNPPYIRKATGFLSENEEKSVAKHEIECEIGTIMRRTAEWLKPGGRACFIYPERRRGDFVAAAEAAGLRLGVVREVCPLRGAPPNLFLSELRHTRAEGSLQASSATHDAPALRTGRTRHSNSQAGKSASGAGGGGKRGRSRDAVIVLPPLILYAEKGVYTAEAEEIFSGRAVSPVWAGMTKPKGAR